MKLAYRGRQGPWWRWPLVIEDDEDSCHPPEPSEQRRQQPRPGAQRELDERPPWMRRSDGTRIDGRKASAHPYLARQMSDFGFRQNP